MRVLPFLPLTLGALCGGCAVEGPEGFFVQLYGRIYDEHGDGVPGAEISLATEDGALIAPCITNQDGWYAAVILADEHRGHALRVVARAEGYASTEAWIPLDLVDGSPQVLPAYPPQIWSLWSRELPALPMALEVNSGQAEGIVLDAISGEPPTEDSGGDLEPVVFEVELRKGWNAPDSERVVGSVETGGGVAEAGRFLFEGIPTGVYTARIPGTGGYTAARFPLLVRSSDAREIRVAVSPALASNEVRATLVWGDAPADLDLHITGPRASVTEGESSWERFHVWAGAPYFPANATDADDRVVAMERVDEDGVGPETVVVYDLRGSGEYRFSVYDASHASEGGVEDLSQSGALVQLWLGARTPEFFEVAPGQPGNTWRAAVWDTEEDLLLRLQELTSVEDEGEQEAF
jgi:hypothetical protein